MKGTRGQVLNEALIAMGIVTVGILGMAGFLSKAIAEGRYISNQTTAVNLAAEGIEIAKNILDGNALSGPGAWNRGFERGLYEVDYSSKKLGDPVESSLRYLQKKTVGGIDLYGYNGGDKTGFRRSIEIDNITDSQIRATSTVYWRVRGTLLNEISLTSDFYYWR